MIRVTLITSSPSPQWASAWSPGWPNDWLMWWTTKRDRSSELERMYHRWDYLDVIRNECLIGKNIWMWSWTYVFTITFVRDNVAHEDNSQFTIWLSHDHWWSNLYFSETKWKYDVAPEDKQKEWKQMILNFMQRFPLTLSVFLYFH